MVTDYIIWNDCVSMGDVLCSFPGTLQLAKQKHREGHIVGIKWTNDAVADLFPHHKYHLWRCSMNAPTTQRISIHDMVHKGIAFPTQHAHPTAQFMAHVGFPELSGAPIRPEITYYMYEGVKVSERPRTYDVLISPYVLAEICRFWPLTEWQQVIDYILRQGKSIAVLGSRTIPELDDLRKIDPHKQHHFQQNFAMMKCSLTGVDYVIDRPLTEVAYLMKKAQAVITVDSGPARLAHAVGCNHLLICNNAVDRNWGTYPEATRTIFDDLQRLRANDVIPFVAELL